MPPWPPMRPVLRRSRRCAPVWACPVPFYEWKSRPDSAAAERRSDLKLLIAKAFEDSDGTYGYRRIALQLARWGVRAGAGLSLSRARPAHAGPHVCRTPRCSTFTQHGDRCCA
jgi:hypothetical protein